jgi:hypothetical protein
VLCFDTQLSSATVAGKQSITALLKVMRIVIYELTRCKRKAIEAAEDFERIAAIRCPST